MHCGLAFADISAGCAQASTEYNLYSMKFTALQMFLGFAKAVMGDQFNLPPPPGLADGTQLGQLLEDADFVDVTRTDYQHNLDFGVMQDAVRFMAGPHSQFAPMLNKLKASGRPDIYQEAAKVSKCTYTVL